MRTLIVLLVIATLLTITSTPQVGAAESCLIAATDVDDTLRTENTRMSSNSDGRICVLVEMTITERNSSDGKVCDVEVYLEVFDSKTSLDHPTNFAPTFNWDLFAETEGDVIVDESQDNDPGFGANLLGSVVLLEGESVSGLSRGSYQFGLDQKKVSTSLTYTC